VWTLGQVLSETLTFLVSWPSIETLQDPGSSVKIYGKRTLTKTRRFVVVQEGETHCHALPIRTYSGKGVAHPGVIKSEHAIVYTGPTAPLAKWDEHPRPGESGMWPLPIRMRLNSSAEDLHEVSRIDLRDVIRIEHDAVVEKYGQVCKESIPDLLEAFRAVWGLDDAIDPVVDEQEDWVLVEDVDDEDDDDERRFDDDEDDDDHNGLGVGDQNENEDGDDGRRKDPGKFSLEDEGYWILLTLCIRNTSFVERTDGDLMFTFPHGWLAVWLMIS
jgi:hypothetical protein